MFIERFSGKSSYTHILKFLLEYFIEVYNNLVKYDKHLKNYMSMCITCITHFNDYVCLSFVTTNVIVTLTSQCNPNEWHVNFIHHYLKKA